MCVLIGLCIYLYYQTYCIQLKLLLYINAIPWIMSWVQAGLYKELYLFSIPRFQHMSGAELCLGGGWLNTRRQTRSNITCFRYPSPQTQFFFQILNKYIKDNLHLGGGRSYSKTERKVFIVLRSFVYRSLSLPHSSCLHIFPVLHKKQIVRIDSILS